MRAPHTRFEERSRGSYVTNITDIVETIFGLRHVKNTPVGDAAIRGVSGGEKKRVSISEALTLRSSITAWDKYEFQQFLIDRSLIEYLFPVQLGVLMPPQPLNLSVPYGLQLI